MYDLNGKRAVVTGASAGIGQATAIAFAEAGADVAGIHLADPEGAAATVAAVEKAGRRALLVEGTTASAEEVEAFADRVEDELGQIDVWVNNAARILVRPFLEMSDEEWHDLLGSNLHGYYHGCRAAVRRMAPRSSGRIVNVSSITATQPIAEMSAYITAKGGIVALTRALAVELGPRGITVNAVAPGATETELTRRVYTPPVRRAYEERIAVGRIGQPPDVAAAIVFLASDAAAYVTGHELVVDGGMTLNGSVGFSEDPPADAG
ncbi:MAG: glucose 1-dehydrogenase [Actinobacteria bacterium]|nr:glucose 1-dehydrogenase [Actinomycetota bacterium]